MDPAAWSTLSARSPASICGSKAWFDAAFKTAHPHAEPLLVAIERGDRLIGLLPLALHGQRNTATLRFAGAPHNDLSDLMVLAGAEEEVAATAIEALCHLRDEGCTIQLESVDPNGVLAFGDHRSRRLKWSVDDAAPTIDLREPWKKSASGRRRRQWNRRQRRLREAHTVQFRQTSGLQMAAQLGEFARLREARCQATGRPSDLPPRRFFEEVIGQLAASERCSFMDLVVDGVPIARDLYLLDAPVAMMWLRALDPAWQRFPCGHLLLRQTAEFLAASGFQMLDLGRGGEPYKFYFGAKRRLLLRATSETAA